MSGNYRDKQRKWKGTSTYIGGNGESHFGIAGNWRAGLWRGGGRAGSSCKEIQWKGRLSSISSGRSARQRRVWKEVRRVPLPGERREENWPRTEGNGQARDF